MPKLERLPFADWPQAERLAWEKAIRVTDDPWDDDGAAADHRPTTRRNYEKAWGYYLAWHISVGEFNPDETPGQRVNEDRLSAWVRHMRDLKHKNGTIRQRLMCLHCVLKFIAPGTDTHFIRYPGGRSIYELFPTRGKAFDPQDAGDLLNLVYERHEAGMAAKPGLKKFKLLRDAAVMAVLYSRAPRISDLAAMHIGEHLITLHDGSFLLRFPGEITKNHQDLEYPLDPEPELVLRDYLVHARPFLPGASDTDALWMGTTGGAFTLRGLEGLIKRRNRNFTGKAEGPHMARKWLADTARKRSPAAAFDAAEVEGHSPETALKHYAQAEKVHASLRQGRRISKLRRQTAGIAERAFRARNARQGEEDIG